MSLRLLAAASIIGVSLLGGAPVATAAPRADSPIPSPSASSSGSGTTATPNNAQRVTFGIGAATHNKLDGRSEIRVLAPLGGDYKDQVAVVNVSAQPLALKVYAANMRNDASGRLEADPAADKPTDLATWLRLTTPTGTSTVVVPKKGMVFVPVTLHVPKNAAVGDHMAAIVVSLSSTGRSSGSTAPNVTLDQRVGLRLALRVAGPMNPHLTVANISANYSGTLNPFGKGKARVTYTVRNDGNLRLGGTQSVTIHGLFGTAAPNVKLSRRPSAPAGSNGELHGRRSRRHPHGPPVGHRGRHSGGPPGGCRSAVRPRGG